MGSQIVNVEMFAAGGKEHLAGKTFSADERQGEPAFAFPAALADTDATLFDLRELRPILHAIPSEKRTPLENILPTGRTVTTSSSAIRASRL